MITYFVFIILNFHLKNYQGKYLLGVYAHFKYFNNYTRVFVSQIHFPISLSILQVNMLFCKLELYYITVW